MQRNRTKRIHIDTKKEIYYERLAQVFMEPQESQWSVVLLETQRPENQRSMVQTQTQRPNSKENQCPRAG